MSFEQCTFSPESAEGYSQTSSWDTRQLSLLSGSHTPAKSCESVPQKDGSPACMCGKGTLGCSIHPSTPESWTASMRDSLAKTLALLESRQAYLREPEAVFTAKSCASLAWFDRDTCSWKTYQRSFLTDSEPYSQTWPRWGMTLAGSAYAHPMSERRITETDGLASVPTPRTQMTRPVEIRKDVANGHKGNLESWVAVQMMWPTPTASQARSEGSILQMRSLVDAGVVAEAEAEAMIAGSLRPKRMKYWQMPTVSCAEHPGQVKHKPGQQLRLTQQVNNPKYWPTPTAHNAKETNAPSESERNTPTLAAQVGGQLSPDWVGWLMGFPIAWANSKAMAMPKSRSKLPQPGECSEVAE
jgi:hypothetical protein